MQASPDFLRDLRAVTSAELDDLSAVLEQLTERSAKNVQELLASKPDDHPMRSAVTAFGMIGYGRRETAYTRALAWLLDPENPHGFADSVLREVWPHIVGEVPYQGFAPQYVTAERSIGTGRIDVWIEGNLKSEKEMSKVLIAVEAKIGAPEGFNQLPKYVRQINTLTEFQKKVFVLLTPDRARFRQQGPWRLVSFGELAHAVWRAASQNMAAQGYHFARLFVAGIFADVLEWHLPISSDTKRPVAVYSYLKHEEGRQ
jgi:hypothetical protein